MNFKAAVKKLDIEEYEDRIFNSNSYGELFHILDYIVIAENIKEECIPMFKTRFELAVKHAKENWG